MGSMLDDVCPTCHIHTMYESLTILWQLATVYFHMSSSISNESRSFFGKRTVSFYFNDYNFFHCMLNRFRAVFKIFEEFSTFEVHIILVDASESEELSDNVSGVYPE